MKPLHGWHLWIVKDNPSKNLLRFLRDQTFAEASIDPSISLHVHPSELDAIPLSPASCMWVLSSASH